MFAAAKVHIIDGSEKGKWFLKTNVEFFLRSCRADSLTLICPWNACKIIFLSFSFAVFGIEKKLRTIVRNTRSPLKL